MPDFLIDGPESGTEAGPTLLLAHGAGAAMDSPSMAALARAFATVGLSTARFEFPYMAARRQGLRKPPPRAETLVPDYRAAVAALAVPGPLVIGGKSMGGRVASLAADALHDEGRVAGLLCLGYPFHPPEKPAQLRTAHLASLRTPTLIVQGTRDPFGTRAEVETYALSDRTEILWLEDGDHDLKPRKSVSGFTAADHLRSLAARVRDWATAL